MKKDKKLDLKVEFKNELDIRVLDESFYRGGQTRNVGGVNGIGRFPDRVLDRRGGVACCPSQIGRAHV